MVDANAKPLEQSQDTASLVKRLAGPSVTKAGLAKDQTEINRIIAEVSKGSKFYENEKRKDKELTERIAKILRIKDEVLKEADIRRVEADADRLFVDLEAERDLTQIIVHVDMDAFYANVELLRSPELEGKPFGVGKGVLSTASYEARKYGVRSGMAGFVAKKLCPELILMPIDFQKYSEMSKKVMAIFKQYDPNMIVAGCDEVMHSITKYCNEHNMAPDECVQRMREQVKVETRLTVSAGIAHNKMLAKNKPNGQFHLSSEREAVVAFMRDLPIRKLPGVGRVNERLLESIGSCGDIYEHRAVIWLMDHYFGKTFLFKAHLGIASNVVQPYQREERKSIGAERTFNPIDDQNKILEKLEEVSIELENDMRENGWAGKTVTLKYKLDTYQVFTRAKSFNRWITRKDDMFNTGKELLKPEFPLCLRLIGLRVTKLNDLHASANQGIKRDAMPGFHEHAAEMDEWPPGEGDEYLEGDEENSASRVPKPTSSRNPPIISTRPMDSRIDAEAHMRLQDSEDEDEPALRTQPCPVCAREIDAADNLALNAHIDFCLSKDAIKQATAASSSDVATPSNKKKGKGNKGNALTRTLSDWKKKEEKRPDRTRRGKKK
ncbi:hypothetical protein EW145_g2752 [Phellinidium pouzarii]|uniref:DNA polymerase kappa n=1 Tax=Phellinidium pouzarii TaxID=167371 RepID=A0A4V3XD48_9AGAM|nr:hypothetical protein EW145_g2752 [Phellinidium pouzarii]